jgi:catechol 2,3-dioxygenase-like lactoylglutathione lyase family enzyme
MHAIMPAMVFYAKDPDVTRQFYETIGLAFVEERHGDGPLHYACSFEGLVPEIYPSRPGFAPKPSESMAFILFVDGFDATLAGIEAMGHPPGAGGGGGPYGADGLKAASVRDPDGRLVRLLERDPSSVQ